MAKKTALYSWHCAQKALMVDFAGWEMPLHYGSQLDEHLCVRQNVGMFDVSHMSSIDIHGPEAKSFLQHVLANDINKLKMPGQALYGCILNHQGGILDDLITYWVADDQYRCVVNAATTEKDLAWFQQNSHPFEVEIVHHSDLSMIAVQGPCALDKAQLLGEAFQQTVHSLKPFHCTYVDDWFVARTGYTGEDGFEFIIPNEKAFLLWQKLAEGGVSPIGLGARDTLRLEAGLNLYGTDIDETVSPFASNLAWTVPLTNERQFIGKDALLAEKKQTTRQVMIGLVLLAKGVLRGGQKVYVDHKMVGALTSGSYSPILKKGIGLARVDSQVQSEYTIEIRGKHLKAKAVSLPFIKKGQPTFTLET